jgi:hypothetical protein
VNHRHYWYGDRSIKVSKTVWKKGAFATENGIPQIVLYVQELFKISLAEY